MVHFPTVRPLKIGSNVEESVKIKDEDCVADESNDDSSQGGDDKV